MITLEEVTDKFIFAIDGLDFEKNCPSETFLQDHGCSTEEDRLESFFRLTRITGDQLAAWLVTTDGITEKVDLSEGVFISVGQPDIEKLFEKRKKILQSKFGDVSHRQIIIQHSGKGLEDGLIFLKQHGKTVHLCRLSKARVVWKDYRVKRFDFETTQKPVEDTIVFTFDHFGATQQYFEIKIRRSRKADDIVLRFEAVGFSEVYDTHVSNNGGLEKIHQVRLAEDRAALNTALICLT